MPYIDPIRRPAINDHIDALIEDGHVDQAGDLTYAMYRLCRLWEQTRPRTFNTLSQVVGVLESLKLEYFQSELGPYEAQKLLDNGGVFEDGPAGNGGRGGPDFSDAAESAADVGAGPVREAV